MPSSLMIPLKVFLLFAIAGHLILSSWNVNASPCQIFAVENALTATLPGPGNVSGEMPSQAPVEESEDEDETSKEIACHRQGCLSFTMLVKQLFIHQNLIFQEPRLDIETPPPRLA